MLKITSTQNKRITDIAKLKSSKQRKESGLFLAEGLKLTEEVLRCGLEVETFFITDKTQVYSFLPDNDKTVVVSEAVMKKISSLTTPPEIITVAKQNKIDISSANEDFILALDAVQDPGNIGAIMRSAEAFGVNTILLGTGCCDCYSSKALRSSMGSVLRLKTIDIDLKNALKKYKSLGYDIIGTGLDRNFSTVDKLHLSKMKVVVIGNEGNGISNEIQKLCDFGMFIPMSGQNESLNAAVAASIIMWENQKQSELQ